MRWCTRVYTAAVLKSNQPHKSYFMSAESGPILKSQPILYYPFSQARYPMYHCTHRSQTIGIDGLSLYIEERWSSRSVAAFAVLMMHIFLPSMLIITKGPIERFRWIVAIACARLTVLLPPFRKCVPFCGGG